MDVALLCTCSQGSTQGDEEEGKREKGKPPWPVRLLARRVSEIGGSADVSLVRAGAVYSTSTLRGRSWDERRRVNPPGPLSYLFEGYRRFER